MKNPGISIIISTYGRAKYLKDLIASVRSTTPADAYEFVIISSDSPESEKIKWLSQQKDVNLILSDVRKKWQLRKKSAFYYINLGIKRSSKEWVFVVNDDMNFSENWYKEFSILVSDPRNSSVGMIIVSTHLGEVDLGSRIVTIGKTKKGDEDWKDLYLSDLSILSRPALEKIDLYDENLDWCAAGVDNSLGIEFLTNFDVITSDKIGVDHFLADENRKQNLMDVFSDFHYTFNKWNKWCRSNNCQFVWDVNISPYTISNRIRNYIERKLARLKYYIRYFFKIENVK